MEKSPLFLDRPLRKAIATALADTPVVCLLGPRQCGKSTLVQSMRPDRNYYDLDDEDFARTAVDDPTGFIRALPLPVTLDEIQRVPELLRSIKVAVDRNRQPGAFILTGSANLLLLPRTSESLAGRIELLQLHPLTEAEKERSPAAFLQNLIENKITPQILPTRDTDPFDLARRITIGGYPEALQRLPQRVSDWHRQYLRTIMEHDVPDIAQIRNANQLQTLLERLAHQSSSLLNQSALSRDLGLDRETIHDYLEILERLFLIRRLPAWHRNRGKRLVKSPKVHLLDSGLAATLMDLRADDWIQRRSDFGRLLESFVVQQLIAFAGWTDSRLRFFHYRDIDKVEVDCVMTRGEEVWGFEIKASQTVRASDTKGLKRLADQAGDDFQKGIIFYNGDSTITLGDDRFLAVPISKIWEL